MQRKKDRDRETETEMKTQERIWKHFEKYKALNKCKYRQLQPPTGELINQSMNSTSLCCLKV